MLRNSRQLIRNFGLAILLALLWTSIAWTCPNCKDTLANDPAQAGLVRGFFWSIVFMVSMPFLIFSGISAYFYWEIRRARMAKQAAAAADVDPPSGSSPFAQPLTPMENVESVVAV